MSWGRLVSCTEQAVGEHLYRAAHAWCVSETGAIQYLDHLIQGLRECLGSSGDSKQAKLGSVSHLRTLWIFQSGLSLQTRRRRLHCGGANAESAADINDWWARSADIEYLHRHRCQISEVTIAVIASAV